MRECPSLELPVELGAWTIGRNASRVLVRNSFQPDNLLFLTRRGFVFFDELGQALRVYMYIYIYACMHACIRKSLYLSIYLSIYL